MESTHSKIAGAKSPDCKTIEIPEDVLKALDELPTYDRSDWEAWEIEVLKKYRKKKRLSDIAKVLNRSMSQVKYKLEKLNAEG